MQAASNTESKSSQVISPNSKNFAMACTGDNEDVLLAAAIMLIKKLPRKGISLSCTFRQWK